jgi:outer membrane biosynthesis protein TonB
MTTSKDRNISLTGTVLFHALLVFLLLNLRNCTGGGGGNGGTGTVGYASMDLAGLGNSIDGWGESEESAADVPPTETGEVVDDAAIAENTNAAAPTVNNDKQSTNNPTPNKNSKPAEKTEAQKQQEKLNALMNQANKAGKGNTTGSGKQGKEDGQVGKNGIFDGGGSEGKGGGEGGGDGGGKGGGKGSGVEHSLKGRKFTTIPELTGNADGLHCKMIIAVTVSPQGDVLSAQVKEGNCLDDFSRASNLAIKAVKLAKFTKSDSNGPQIGTVTINFEAN